MAEPTLIQIKDHTGNPAPLGLFGFGMTTILLNIHNCGFIPMSTMILAMGICYGGAAQVIAGIMEWKKNNTFAATAFISYGFFWLSLVTLILLPVIAPKLAPTENSLATYLALWGLFTLGLFVATFRLSIALQVVFGTLTILFFLLAASGYISSYNAADRNTDGDLGLKVLAGYEGIFCGLSACYVALAHILNEAYGRTVLPLGVVLEK